MLVLKGALVAGDPLETLELEVPLVPRVNVAPWARGGLKDCVDPLETMVLQ